MGVLVVENPHRSVGHGPAVRAGIRRQPGVGNIDTEPFGGAGDIRQRRVALRVRVELCIVGHDQALVRLQGSCGSQYLDREQAIDDDGER